jgi:hypothetical protein
LQKDSGWNLEGDKKKEADRRGNKENCSAREELELAI